MADTLTHADDTSLDLLRGLIAASRDGEAAVQARVAAALEALGCRVERLRYHPAEVTLRHEFAAEGAMAGEARESIVARFPGSGGGRSVIFFAHPDGEPVQHPHGWRHDPFAGVVEEGRLYGWGVSDDLAGVAAMVDGLRTALAQGARPAGDVILASTPSKRHARGVHAVMQQGVLADAAVYLHPAESGVGMREVKTLASGQLLFRVTLRGRLPDTTEPGHAAFAHTAVNPVDLALAAIAALRALDARRGERVRHPALDGAIGRSTNLLVSQVTAQERLGRVPALCSFGVAISFPPGEALDAVRAEVEAALRDAVLTEPRLRAHPPEIEWLSGVTGAEVPPEHPLWQVVAQAVASVTGAAPHANPLHTSSDIRNPMVQQGIPCVGLGPLGGDLTQNGRRDEWVDVADYRRSVAVVAAVIAGWCVAPPAGR